MNAKCNIFKNSFSPRCNHEVSILQVLKGIRDGRWKDIVESVRECEDKNERSELKKSLPAVTFSGTFNDTRKEKNLKEYSSLMVIDIDDIKPNELGGIKDSLSQDPYIISFFESPSRGIKALVQVDSDAEHHKSWAFPFVQEYFKDAHDIKIDRSGKDISRLCYVSYDPDLYFAKMYDIFSIPEDFAEVIKASRENRFESLKQEGAITESHDMYYVFKTCKKWVTDSSIGAYRKGNRNNFVHALACCLNRAGMSISIAVQLISSTYQSLEMNEIEITVNSAYKNNSDEFGSRPIFIKKGNQQSLI